MLVQKWDFAGITSWIAVAYIESNSSRTNLTFGLPSKRLNRNSSTCFQNTASCKSTLPASWYTSKAIYDLERRGIFMKSWILLGAVTRWPDAEQDYHGEMAQIEYIIRRSSPDWKTIKVFAKDGSEIRTHLTSNGLLFVTFSDDIIGFDEFFPGLTDLISQVDFTELPIRRPLTYPVEYNWKTMIDGYQECLHCAYAHPEFSKRYAPQTYKVINHHNYSRHITSADGSDGDGDGVFVYLFPNSTLSVYGGGMTCWRACPSDEPTRAVMEFDYYHKAPLEDPEFEEFFRFTRHVALEDIGLCVGAQENLNAGIYTAGLLNPDKENGVVYYQSRVLAMCSREFEKGSASLATRVTAAT